MCYDIYFTCEDCYQEFRDPSLGIAKCEKVSLAHRAAELAAIAEGKPPPQEPEPCLLKDGEEERERVCDVQDREESAVCPDCQKVKRVEARETDYYDLG